MLKYILLAAALYMNIAMVSFAKSHPWMTNAENFSHWYDIATFTKVEYQDTLRGKLDIKAHEMEGNAKAKVEDVKEDAEELKVKVGEKWSDLKSKFHKKQQPTEE